jgi:hypothetical protein
MATYYWVGGSGTWNTSTTTNWAASSGGAGSAGVPTAADNVIFDANSGAAPVVTISSAVCSACTIGAPTSGTLTLAFGSSSLTMAGNLSITTTISVTGTGTITLSAASPTFAGNGNTFYNVSFTSVSVGAIQITGANTFNNLTFAARNAGFGVVQFDNATTTTVNGTLTINSINTGAGRLMFRTNLVGSPTTLSVTTLAALIDVDFRDIIASGASSPWSGTRIGNCLGNSNITFTAARTVYWVSAASANWSGAVWNTTSGNTGGATINFPLAQDTVVIDNAGLTAGNTITLNSNYVIGTLSFNTRSTAATFATGAFSPAFYGDLSYSSSVTVSGTATFGFQKQNGNATITSAAKTFTQSINISAPNGTVRINGDLTLGSTLTTTLTQGTLDLTNNGAGNYVLSTGLFSSNNSNIRTIAFGTGNITVTGNNATVWTTGGITNLSVTGTPIINATYSGSTGTRTVAMGNGESISISVNVSAGSDIFTLSNNGTVKDLNFTGFTGTWSNVGANIFGSLTVSAGMTVGAGANNINFITTGGSKTITTAGKTFDFPITFDGVGGTFTFQDALTQGSTRTFLLINGTVKLKASATSTTGAFITSGTSQKYLQSTLAGTQATLSQASGTVDVSYLTIQDINAIGGASWNAYVNQSNIDAGNNDGWNFGISPVIGGAEYTYALRSFTEHGRF